MRRLAVIAAALLFASCGGGGGDSGGGAASTAAARPSSPATISIVSPKNGDVIKGTSTEVRMDLEGGKVVPSTVTKVTPTTGHIHMLVDGKVISMNYSLNQKLTGLKPGTHTLRVEFVAADHLPFDPRVFDEIAITVK